MNIFAVADDPYIAAKYLCDRHVVKMLLETAQILCTVTGGGPYKATHTNHPCTKWTARSPHNREWLISHGLALGDQYFIRFNREHKSFGVIWDIAKACPPRGSLPGRHEEFAQVVPEDLRNGNPIIAYRKYYGTKAVHWHAQRRPMKWTHIGEPPWFRFALDHACERADHPKAGRFCACESREYALAGSPSYV